MAREHGLEHAYQKPGIDGEAYFNRKGRYAIEDDDEIEAQDQRAGVVSMRGLSLRQRVQANLLQWYHNH